MLAKKEKKIPRIEVRRMEVARLMKNGMTYREIARELGVSLRTVWKDGQKVIERWRKEAVSEIDEHFILDMRRLDDALVAISANVRAGDFGAVDRLVKILERRAKMLGYDAPEQHSFNMKNEITEMTDEQLIAIAANGNAGSRSGG